MFRKRTWMLVAVLALSFTLYGCMQNFTGLEGAHGFGPVSASGASQRYVVAFNAEAIPPDAEAIVAASGGTLAKTFPRIGIAIAQSSDPDFAQNLGKNASVYAVSVERHHDLPPLEVEVFEEASGPDPGIDTYYYQYQWDIRRVRADQAWEITSGSHNTVVAVLDTGVAWNHPDLAPNVVYHSCYSVFSPCTDYPNLHWHGTHVAGTVAAAFGGGRIR